MESTVLDKELARLDRDLERIYQKRDKIREQRAQLCDEYIKQHELVPSQSFAKAVWKRNGKTYRGVVFVTVNHMYRQDDGSFKVLPNLLKCEPIPADKDDHTEPHYYTEYWEKKRKFIVYDELLSIEPYDAPRQTCGRCIWMHVRKDGNQLKSGCNINLGYKCKCGSGFACDRFHWWSQERSVGMTHYEWMRNQAFQSEQETMDIQ